MKQVIKILSITLLLYTGVSQGYEFDSISGNSLDLGSNAYHFTVTKQKKGLLETTKISLGTIYKSHHFNNDDYNETHNGIYVSVEGWSVGTYENSGNVQSVFVTYNPNLYRGNSVEINLVTGVADGYEGWDYAQNGYLPILGVSAKWMNLKAMLSPDLVALGVELPLN
ncbi:MAG: hypothetical protein GY875_21425 [Gammaproteobacteria bacterium]|nr:hypothetical protein [Gammaproteobacteria bacterium]